MFSGDRGHQDITKSFTYWTNPTNYVLDGHAKKLYRIPYVDKNGRLHCVNSVARCDHEVLPGEGKHITNNRHIPSCRPYDHYCCALRDDDESVTGDANRRNFLPMLKLTSKMQPTFYDEANIILHH